MERIPHCLRVCHKYRREAIGYAMICKPEDVELHAIHLCSELPRAPGTPRSRLLCPVHQAAFASEKQHCDT